MEKQMKRMVFDLTCTIEGVTILDMVRDKHNEVDVVEGTIQYFKCYIKDMYAPIKIAMSDAKGGDLLLFMSQKHQNPSAKKSER